MTRLCIVRDLSREKDTTAPMACAKAIHIAQSGQWGKDWAIDECLENPHGSAPILERRLTYTSGKLILNTDEDIFLEHFKVD